MPSVDNRIVRMEFDNAAFERKIQTTLDSLKKLDQSLKMQGAKKGLQDVDVAAKKIDLTNVTKGFHGVTTGLGDVSRAAKQVNVDAGTISRGIEGVSKGFIAMSTVAVSAISSITFGALQGALGAAQRSVGTVVDGFREYETNLNSIQTILANTESKGSTLKNVNDALQQLNIYSDKTIYNFGQMARNIGTFTAAGIGLDESVDAIKGIAQLAAVSGSNSEQASTAMYQLSQALAAGRLSLMDWNSVVNAGMGGEIFKTRLLETAQALGKINSFPLGTTFKEWEKANGPFRESLQDGKITADVLSTALATFTGDLSDAELAAKGFSSETIKSIQKSAKTATGAATEVKSFTQLMSTVKEAIGTGFADSFRIVLGDFAEAKSLFTGINNAIGGFVANSAAARNEILGKWKKLGGRDSALEILNHSFVNLMAIIRPIRKAFRDVFPPLTGQRLFEITKNIEKFVKAMKPSRETLLNLRRIFTGLFSVLKIGITIISSVVKLFGRMAKAIVGAAGPGFLELAANIADVFTGLRKGLVDGGAITDFFDGLFALFTKTLPVIQRVGDFLRNLFGGVSEKSSSGVSKGIEKLGDGLSKLEPLTERVQKRFETLRQIFAKIGDFFKRVGGVIGDALSTVVDNITNALGGGNYDKLLDGLNTALFGGLLLLIRRFLKQGLKIDLSGGLLEKIGGSFDALTGALKSMQLKIKAEAIMKIAVALAILTASLLVLSLIDSEALSKALIAMGVAFGQLVTVLAALNKLEIGPKTALAFAIISVGMVGLGVSMLLLSAAAKQLASLDWPTLIKGLTGVTALMAALVAAARLMQKASADMIKAGAGILLMSVALILLGQSAKIFAEMDTGQMAKGFAGVAAGLIALGGALRAMPEDKNLPGTQLILTGLALQLFATAVKKFASLDWQELAKGLGAFGVTLGVIVVAMRKMPDMKKQATSFIAVGIAVNLLAIAIGKIGSMDTGVLAKGIIAIAAALAVLAVAAHAMQGTLAGSAAILVISGALLVLGLALTAIAKLNWEDLLLGLAKIAVVLAAFAAAALLMQPALPALIGLGVALGLLGIAFAAVGVGAYAVAKAFEVFGRVGPKAFDNFKKAMKSFAQVLPDLFRGFAEGLIEMVKMILDAAPELVEGLAKLFTALLDAVLKIIPKLQEVLGELIKAGMATIRTYAAEYIETGLFIITKLLEGIRNNIGNIVTLVIEIVENFVNALSAQANTLIGAGLNLLLALLRGVVNNIFKIAETVTTIITTFIAEVAKNYGRIITAGGDAFVKFVQGIRDNIVKIADAVGEVITSLINAVANNYTRVVTAGGDLIIKFLEGIRSNAPRIVSEFAKTAVAVIGSILQAISDTVPVLADKVIETFIALFNGMADVIDQRSAELGESMGRFAKSIVKGFGTTFFSAIKTMVKDAIPGGIFAGPIRRAVDEVFDALGIHSPSRVFLHMAEMCMVGFALGIENNSELPNKAIVNAGDMMTKTLSKVSSDLQNTSEFNPTITPVLDLTKVAADASLINSLLPNMAGTLSFAQANSIAATQKQTQESNSEISPGGTSEVKFEQNIFAPEQLSTADIYKQTRNQITIAKEELKIR